MQIRSKLFKLSTFLFFTLTLFSCKKLDEFNRDPDIEPLKQGFKVSAAISYCTSLASMAFKGEDLPGNVTFQKNSNSEYSGAGIIYVNVTEENPLPFNSNIGDIIIAGIWDEVDNGGVISIVFADIDLISPNFQFYGIHTVPVAERLQTGEMLTVFAEQDIVMGEGSDTLLSLSLSRPKFDLELDRLNTGASDDVFTAVKQNIWFITIDQNDPALLYDDSYEINGGGQIAEASNTEGGITYHAMIKTQFNNANCTANPTNGVGFIQHIKAGSGIDLGNITLEFHPSCDGKAKVKIATGEYFSANGRNVNLNFN